MGERISIKAAKYNNSCISYYLDREAIVSKITLKKMVKIAILFALSAIALAAAQPVQQAKTLRDVNVPNDGSGSFRFT